MILDADAIRAAVLEVFYPLPRPGHSLEEDKRERKLRAFRTVGGMRLFREQQVRRFLDTRRTRRAGRAPTGAEPGPVPHPTDAKGAG